MPRKLTQSETDELEQLIDSTGLYEVAQALEQICHEKADHVQSNWQDRNLARAWTKQAKEFEKLKIHVP